MKYRSERTSLDLFVHRGSILTAVGTDGGLREAGFRNVSLLLLSVSMGSGLPQHLESFGGSREADRHFYHFRRDQSI
jgi:hypothetical protein